MATLKAQMLDTCEPCEITTEHPASSYGVPVVVVGGVPHGPADLTGRTVSTAPLHDPADGELVERARSAGYDVMC